MNLSGLMQTLGGAFQGLSSDQQRELQRRLMSQRQEEGNFERSYKMRQDGYAPLPEVAQVMQGIQSRSILPTGSTANDPGQLAREIAGRLRTRHEAEAPPASFQVPGQQERWAALPFDQSPAGLALARSQANRAPVATPHIPENSMIPDGRGGWIRAGGVKPAEPRRAPATRQTARGVENWNETTGTWDVEKDASGLAVMPYQAPSQQAAGPTAAERAQGARTAATYKASKTTLDNLKDAIKRYRGQLEASGVEIIPGDAKSLTESAYANLMLQGKEAAKLGVLAGPDMAILEQLVNDPTTLGSAAKNVFQVGGRAKSIAKQLDQYEAIIDGYVARNEQNYNGGADPDASPAQKDWDALAARHGKEVTTKRIGPRP